MLPRRRVLQIGAAAALALDGLTPGVSNAAGATTWNPADKTTNASLSNGSLSATIGGGVQGGVRCTNGLTTGKAFFELTITAMPPVGSNDNFSVGVCNASYALSDSNDLGFAATSIGIYLGAALQIYFNGVQISAGANPDAVGSVISVALDATVRRVWFTSTEMRAEGHSWNHSTTANPATGSGGIDISALTGPLFATYCDAYGSAVTANFGASTFNQPVPSGFQSWNASVAPPRPLAMVQIMGGMGLTAPTVIPPPSSGGPGPTASSTFLTADFASPFNYPNGGTGQQIVSQKMWGVSTGGAGNDLGSGFFSALATPQYQNLMAIANPGLWYFKNSNQSYWNSDLSVIPSSVANLVNNFYKCDPLGISGVIIGTDFNLNVQGSAVATSTWGTAMANLASYLFNYTMPNGKKFPLVGMMGHDEANAQGYAEATVASYYNDLSPKLKAISSNLLLVGPNNDYVGWTNFGSLVPGLDVFSGDYYPIQNGASAYNDMTYVNNNFTPIGAGASGATGSNVKALFYGGYNIDSQCSAPAMNSYPGAMFRAKGLILSLNQTNRPLWACSWDAFGDGTCGEVTYPGQSGAYYGVDSTYRLTPKGYLNGAGVRNIYGPRWSVTGSAISDTFLALAVTPDTARFGFKVVNAGRGSQSNRQVAFSHWPVNSTGNGTVNVWQMDSSVTLPGTDGTRSTASVVNGIATLSFPDPSTTIIYV